MLEDQQVVVSFRLRNTHTDLSEVVHLQKDLCDRLSMRLDKVKSIIVRLEQGCSKNQIRVNDIRRRLAKMTIKRCQISTLFLANLKHLKQTMIALETIAKILKDSPSSRKIPRQTSGLLQLLSSEKLSNTQQFIELRSNQNIESVLVSLLAVPPGIPMDDDEDLDFSGPAQTINRQTEGFILCPIISIKLLSSTGRAAREKGSHS